MRKGEGNKWADEEFFGEVWTGVWKFSKIRISFGSPELGKAFQKEGHSKERHDSSNRPEDKVGAGARVKAVFFVDLYVNETN